MSLYCMRFRTSDIYTKAKFLEIETIVRYESLKLIYKIENSLVRTNVTLSTSSQHHACDTRLADNHRPGQPYHMTERATAPGVRSRETYCKRILTIRLCSASMKEKFRNIDIINVHAPT